MLQPLANFIYCTFFIFNPSSLWFCYYCYMFAALKFDYCSSLNDCLTLCVYYISWNLNGKCQQGGGSGSNAKCIAKKFVHLIKILPHKINTTLQLVQHLLQLCLFPCCTSYWLPRFRFCYVHTSISYVTN